LFPTASQI